MPSLIERLQFVRALPPRGAADVLIDALPWATDEELPDLCRLALETGESAAVIAVVKVFHRLDEDGRVLVRRSTRAVAPTLESVIEAGGVQAAANALELIRDRADPGLCPLVTGLLESPVSDLNVGAASVLFELVRPWTERPAERRWDEAVRRQLDDAVAIALETYRKHRSVDALRAAALLAPWAGPKLEVLLSEEDHPATLAMRGLAERQAFPDVRRNLLRWLSTPELARSVARWMHTAATPDAFDEVLSAGHLLMNPDRRRAVRRIDRALHCIPGPTVVPHISPERQRDLARWLEALPISARHRASRAQVMFSTAHPIVRLRLWPRLMSDKASVRDATINRALNGNDAVTARVAMRRALRQPVIADDMLTALIAGGTAAVTQRALVRAAQQHLPAFIASFERFDAPQRRVLGRSWLRDDRSAFLDMMRRSLVDSAPARADGLIRLARELRLISDIETELVALTESPSMRLAASAVIALADGASSSRLHALRAATQHANDRVRANAVEALASVATQSHSAALHPRAARWLAALQSDANNRLRANAILALVRGREAQAAAALKTMLTDDRPLHRVSAIWVASRSGPTSLSPVLDDLASNDPLVQVRRRAERARRLLRTPPAKVK
ncbi:MAG: HEAT repeat domain-containing protein [Planctomycetota bacterium]